MAKQDNSARRRPRRDRSRQSRRRPARPAWPDWPGLPRELALQRTGRGFGLQLGVDVITGMPPDTMLVLQVLEVEGIFDWAGYPSVPGLRRTGLATVKISEYDLTQIPKPQRSQESQP